GSTSALSPFWSTRSCTGSSSEPASEGRARATSARAAWGGRRMRAPFQGGGVMIPPAVIRGIGQRIGGQAVARRRSRAARLLGLLGEPDALGGWLFGARDGWPADLGGFGQA